MTPVLRAEAPPDLDARREMRFETRSRETQEAGEGRNARNLHGPESEAVLVEVILSSRHEGVALPPCKRRRQILGDSRVSVHRSEGREVSGQPAAEQQSAGSDLSWRRLHGAI